MRHISLSLLTLGAFLGGCVSDEPQNLDPVKTQADWESRGLGDPGLAAFLATHGMSGRQGWDLTALTLAAFYLHPSLDVARAEVAAAQAGVTTAGARPNPTLNVGPAYNTDASPGVSPWILGFSLDLPVELGNRRKYRREEAGRNLDVARLDLAAAAWSVRRGVRTALADLKAARETAAFWKGQTPFLEKGAKLMEAQAQAGEVSVGEASRARLTLERAKLAVRDAEAGSRSALHGLAEAIGLPAAALSGVRFVFAEPDPSPRRLTPVEARLWAAQNRADLLAELASYAASQAALRLEIARQYPDLSVSPGYELDQGEGKWSLGLGVTLPIFDRNQGPIAAALARRAAAAAKFVAAQGRVLAEVDRALADHESALKNLAAVRGLKTRLDRQTGIARARFEAGETSRLELVLAQAEAADTLKLELEARQRLAKAVGQVEDAVQRPLGWSESAWASPARHSVSP